jgi:cysteine desulfurase
MMPFLTGKFGNPSSIHFFGQEARAAVDLARHRVAELINSRPNEIVFTSGGTEANNLAIRGLAEANSKYGKHIIISSIEHPAVREVCADLESSGFEVCVIPVSEDGIVNADDAIGAIRDDTILISLMLANNEIGTIQPVAEIGRHIRFLRESGRRIWLHTDAVQAAGKIPVDVEDLRCDLLSLSAHKIYAPKGVGALYIRRGVRLHKQNYGGHQEREKRGGTENVPCIAAYGKACELARRDLEVNARHLRTLRDRFENEVGEKISDLVFNGRCESRLPNISNISFRGIEGEGLLINLDMAGIAVSTGSACSSGSLEPSPVIRALGRDDELSRGAIRFSFGTDNTEADVDIVLKELPRAIETLRRLSPAYK